MSDMVSVRAEPSQTATGRMETSLPRRSWGDADRVTLEIPVVGGRRRRGSAAAAVGGLFAVAVVGFVGFVWLVSGMLRHELTADDQAGIRSAWPCSIVADVTVGSSGADAACVETALARLGYGAGVDGVFDAGDVAVLQTFQRSAGRTPDGVVGPRTAASLGITWSAEVAP